MKRTTKIFVLVLIMAAVCAPLSPAQASGFPGCIPFVNWACVTWYWYPVSAFQICAQATSGFDIASVIASIEVKGFAFKVGIDSDKYAVPVFDAPVVSGESPLQFCTRSWDLEGTTGAVEINAYAAAVIGSDGRLTIPGAYASVATLCWTDGGWPHHCALV